MAINTLLKLSSENRKSSGLELKVKSVTEPLGTTRSEPEKHFAANRVKDYDAAAVSALKSVLKNWYGRRFI